MKTLEKNMPNYSQSNYNFIYDLIIRFKVGFMSPLNLKKKKEKKETTEDQYYIYDRNIQSEIKIEISSIILFKTITELLLNACEVER